jgi:hypothetical protein
VIGRRHIGFASHRGRFLTTEASLGVSWRSSLEVAAVGRVRVVTVALLR